MQSVLRAILWEIEKKNIRRMCYITQPDLMTLFYENMCDGLDAIDTIYSHQHWYMV